MQLATRPIALRPFCLFDDSFQMPQVAADPLASDPTDQWSHQPRRDSQQRAEVQLNVLPDDRPITRRFQSVIDSHTHPPLIDLHAEQLVLAEGDDLARSCDDAVLILEPLMEPSPDPLASRLLMRVGDHLRNPLQDPLWIIQPQEDLGRCSRDQDIFAGANHGVSMR